MKILTTIIFSVLILEHCYCQSFTNSSLELWASTTVCETNTPPDGWTNYSNVGLGPDEGNLVLCASTIPPIAADGNIYARCLAGNPGTGEGMYQYVPGFTIGASYIISYDFCGSNRWGGNGDCVWHLFIDDVDVNQSTVFSSADSVWHTDQYTFTATLTTHKIGVRAYTPAFNGGGSAAIDHFIILRSGVTDIENNSIATDIFVSPNPFENLLSVKCKSKKSVTTFRVFDIVGRAIFSQQFFDFISFNTEMLPRGIYFYEALNEGKMLKKGKVIKD